MPSGASKTSNAKRPVPLSQKRHIHRDHQEQYSVSDHPKTPGAGVSDHQVWAPILTAYKVDEHWDPYYLNHWDAVSDNPRSRSH